MSFFKHPIEIKIANGIFRTKQGETRRHRSPRLGLQSLLHSVLLLPADAYLMWTYFQLNNLVHGQQQGRSRSLLMGTKSSGVIVQLRKFGLGVKMHNVTLSKVYMYIFCRTRL